MNPLSLPTCNRTTEIPVACLTLGKKKRRLPRGYLDVSMPLNAHQEADPSAKSGGGIALLVYWFYIFLVSAQTLASPREILKLTQTCLSSRLPDFLNYWWYTMREMYSFHHFKHSSSYFSSAPILNPSNNVVRRRNSGEGTSVILYITWRWTDVMIFTFRP